MIFKMSEDPFDLNLSRHFYSECAEEFSRDGRYYIYNFAVMKTFGSSNEILSESNNRKRGTVQYTSPQLLFT